MNFKKFFLHIFNFLFIFLLLFSNSFCFGATEDNSITVNAPVALLMDANTGKILYEKNAYERMYPASTTKIMTAILALENSELSHIAKVSYNAIFSVPVRL